MTNLSLCTLQDVGLCLRVDHHFHSALLIVATVVDTQCDIGCAYHALCCYRNCECRRSGILCDSADGDVAVSLGSTLKL